MRTGHISRFVLLICIFAGLMLAWLVPPGGALGAPSYDGPEFAPGRLLVGLEPGLKDMGISGQEKTLDEMGVQVVQSIEGAGVVVVSVPEGEELQKARELAKEPGIAYVEPDYRVSAIDTVPNDPYFNPRPDLQWGLDNIKAPEAWDFHTGTSAVTIAIIDTGVDGTHQDLTGKVLAGYDFVGDTAIPANTDSDPHSHGTHCAGIAAAQTNNGIGVAGVSWGARIMPVRVLDSGGSGWSSDVALGITWAVNNGAKVLSLSLGGYSYSSSLRSAVAYAHSSGAMVIAAAGNDATSLPSYPASYPYVISVAATDSSDGAAWFSNYGSYIDVSAPGVGIYSTVPGGYGYKSGTSMATPFVSGLAALIWTYSPTLTNDEVEAIIKCTAMDIGSTGWDNYTGYGLIDAESALEGFCLVTPSESSNALDDVGTRQPNNPYVTIQIKSTHDVDWEAALNPATSWLTIGPPTSGTIMLGSASVPLNISAPAPPTPGDYQTEMVITGTKTATGYVLTETVDVYLMYRSELHTSTLPIIMRVDYP